MMENVIKLPEKPVREWFILEKGLRATLSGYGADADMTNYVCEALRPVFMKNIASESDFNSTASMTADEVIKDLNDWVHALTSGLLVELAVREIELYRLRGNKPTV
jgi:hypothetical protein